PNSSFVFPIGQAISRTTYSALFAMFGTTYGSGDGSTTFNLPDKRGRVSSMQDSSTGRLPGFSLGTTGGEAFHVLSANEIPTITGINTNSQSYSLQSGQTTTIPLNTANIGASGGAGAFVNQLGAANVSGFITIGSGTIAFQSTNTAGGNHNNVQPTIACNYIIRII
ncbi:MAG TPA: tail fiber protein, partial [Bradyrhizobium sp.]|nr:tail fiber protein [Bradyrhizobium sp.]